MQTETNSTTKTKSTAKRAERTPLKTICGQLKIETKAARVVLRKAIRNGDLPKSTHEIGESRWDLTPVNAVKAKAILKAHFDN